MAAARSCDSSWCNRRIAQAQAGKRRYSESERRLSEGTFTLGDRFGRQKKSGILIGGSWEWNGRGIDDIEPVPDIATFANGTTQSRMDVREYEYFRSRWGLAVTVDYRIADGSAIYLRGLYSDFKNYGNRWAYTLVDNTPGIQVLNPANVGCPTNAAGFTTTPCTAAPTFTTQLRNPDIDAGSLVLGGSHVLASTWYNWEVRRRDPSMATRRTQQRSSATACCRAIGNIIRLQRRTYSCRNSRQPASPKLTIRQTSL